MSLVVRTAVTKNDPERAELLFLRSYRDAIMYFNMLDRNLAYCLRWAAESAGRSASLSVILALPFDRKLKKVVALIRRKKRKSEYAEFLSLAEECRKMRNKLVHGHWEFVPRLEQPIRFHVPAPFEEKGGVTQEEFSGLAASFGRANSLFRKLRASHPIEQ